MTRDAFTVTAVAPMAVRRLRLRGAPRIPPKPTLPTINPDDPPEGRRLILLASCGIPQGTLGRANAATETS